MIPRFRMSINDNIKIDKWFILKSKIYAWKKKFLNVFKNKVFY